MAVLGTSIEWTDATWSPTRGCSRVSAGCDNCYAMRQAHRYDYPGGPYEGLTRVGKRGVDWSGRVRLVPEALAQPLRWRKPQMIFVNSMSDLFHESLSEVEIAKTFTIMETAHQHTFQILTKRAKRMQALLSHPHFPSLVRKLGYDWLGPKRYKERGPHWRSNVWLGVSVEDQATADERIPLLLQTPAAVRFVSYEPALGPIRFSSLALPPIPPSVATRYESDGGGGRLTPAIDWMIVGGESGPKARPFDVAWARSVIQQCREAGVACFVKQLGAQPYSSDECDRAHYSGEDHRLNTLCDSKGGNPSEWPEDLRVREFPA